MNPRSSLATAVLISLMAGMGSPIPVITPSPRRKPDVQRESFSYRSLDDDLARISAAQSKRERRMARNKALNRDAAP